METPLTQRKLYEIDVFGFTKFEKFLSEEKVEYINRLLDKEFAGKDISFFPFYELDEIFADLLVDPRVLSVCHDMLGPQFRIDHIYGIQREPDTACPQGENLHAGPMANQGSYQYSWHAGKPRSNLMLFMYCLEPVYEGDGGLVIIPGSHKQSMPLDGAEVYDQIIHRDFDQWFVHQPTFEPGDMMLMLESVVHGTKTWTPARRRRNLYYKYAPGFVAWRNPEETAKYMPLARNEIERNLFRHPYVGSYDETETPRWRNVWRTETLGVEYSKPYKYAVCRIVGNELPPRDRPGARLEVLRSILDNERLPVDAKRVWILNHIIDPEYKQQVQDLLTSRGETYYDLPFSIKRYLTYLTPEEKILYAININRARNEAIKQGKKIARLVLILDGDNYLSADAWTSIVADVDQNPDVSYFYSPIQRVESIVDAAAAKFEPQKAGEPIVIMRSNAEETFAETIAFGNNEKVELLNRLGISSMDVSGLWDTKQASNRCKRAGYVLHLPTGEPSVEENMSQRHQFRKQAVEALLARLDEMAKSSADPKERLYYRAHSLLKKLPPDIAKGLIDFGKNMK